MGTTAVSRLNWKKLGERIREIRDEKGWSQRQAARAVRRQQPDVSTVEHGQLQLTVEALSVWADAMGISIHECIEELMHPDENTALSEKEAAVVLGWSSAKVRKNRERLRAWQDDAGRWCYWTYAVHDVRRREEAREEFQQEDWESGEI